VASAAEFIIRLQQQVDGPADKATSALNKLESQIMREQAALGGLESKLDSAKVKLASLEAAGAAGKAAGIEKQGQAVDDLAEKLDYARRQIAFIKDAGSGGDVAALDKFKQAAAELSGKLETAKGKLDALSTAGPSNASVIEAQKKAIGELQSKIAEKGSGLAAMNDAVSGFEKMSAASKAAAADAAKLAAAEEAAAAKTKAAADTAAAAQEAHAKKFKEFAEAAKGAKAPVDGTAQAVDALKDKMPQLDGNLGKAQQALAKLGPAGVAVAAAFAVVVIAITAVVGAIISLASATIAASQAKDALIATFGALSTGAASGKEVLASVNAVADALPFARAETQAWAKALMGAGVQGDVLKGRIMGVASATALMGKEGGDAAQNLFKKLASGGQAADEIGKAIKAGGGEAAEALAKMGLQGADLARVLGVTPEKMKTMKLSAVQLGDAIEKAITEKGAGSLEAMGLTWTSISAKLSDGVDSLFADMSSAVTPFMAEVKSLFAEFFTGSTTMETAKDVITAGLTALFSVATTVVNFLHKGFLQVEIAAFKVVAALWPIISVIIAIGSNATVWSGLIFMLKTIAVLVAAVAAPLFIVTAAFWAVGTVIFAVLSAIVGAILWCVGDAVRAFGVLGATISAWVSGAVSAASNFVSGIVAGISNGAGLVVDAVKNLASSAMSAFTGFFKIKSPSQLMADTAIHIPGGAAVGIEAGTGDVVDAMEGMGDAGMAGSSKGFGKAKGAGSGASGGGGDVYNLNVQYSGKKEDFPDFETMFLQTVQKLRGMAPRST